MSDSQQLFCSIRKEWIVALPEEKVRQRLLFHMIQEKGFPASLIAVEQSLRELPHLSSVSRHNLPNRRADIICFANGVDAPGVLSPLLIVECKSVKLSPNVMNQIVGYNHFVGSPFIALANQEEIRLGWYDIEKKDYTFLNFLPFYSELKTLVDFSRNSPSITAMDRRFGPNQNP